MFAGSYVALITPMHPDGSLDESALAQLIEWHVAEGTNGIVPVGKIGRAHV